MANKTFLGNAFSLQMLDTAKEATVTVSPVTADEVALRARWRASFFIASVENNRLKQYTYNE